ncbi:XrtA/PEP-CTERM system amidotransferase [Sphingomonas sp.]|jgi:asparagine synthase (glutamine-hydrolysing)|uniref:XrtA/PEP-CTERM system amidotransferase n=1 Tax=Sphingomonas sp. TaxID=28214 RepID=UPI0035C86F60
MCAIAGLFYPATPKPVDPARVRAMADAMAHRGPDGAGSWTAPGVGLAHRRLAIIDLAGSPQPMASADARYAIVFNGEIYNYRELRAELIAAGRPMHTQGDTEVLLEGYALWGPALLDRLVGMFAFAIHDAATQSLFMARDRLGVKPLHYAELADGALAFASELKGLMAHPLVRRTPDLRAVEDYLAFGYVPDDACLLAGVRKLPAGHFLLVERGKPVAAPRRWWQLSFAERARGRSGDLQEALLAHLREGVRSRMVADVPTGAFLSGGVDSSTVVALMAEASRAAVTTCTIGFEETDHDERDHARSVAQRFATAHHERVVAAGDMALIPALTAAFDEPFADASALSGLQVAALARESVTVALSGDGADEMMAGYRRYRFQAAEERVRAMIPATWRAPVFGALGRAWPKADWAPRPLRARTTLLALATGGEEAYARSVGVTSPEVRASLFSAEATAALQGHRAEDRYIAAMRAAPARHALDRAQYADMTIWLPGDILTKTDRTSMAVSLEVREPLLDHRLVEFCATLPPALRLRGGQGKWLMKRAMAQHLPDEILHRPKMGFVTPVSAWFRTSLAARAAALPRSRVLAETGWFDLDQLARLTDAHRAGRAEHGRTLWQFLMLEQSIAHLFG